jgi:hypothetical protein
VRQLAAALAWLPDISCIFEGASKLAHSKDLAFDKSYAALGMPAKRQMLHSFLVLDRVAGM